MVAAKGNGNGNGRSVVCMAEGHGRRMAFEVLFPLECISVADQYMGEIYATPIQDIYNAHATKCGQISLATSLLFVVTPVFNCDTHVTLCRLLRHGQQCQARIRHTVSCLSHNSYLLMSSVPNSSCGSSCSPKGSSSRRFLMAPTTRKSCQ